MSQRFSQNVNGKNHNVDIDPDMPLLYALRNDIGLNNPHYDCGLAQCGASTVHLDGGATDPGHAISPAQIEHQIAASFVYGLSSLFYQEGTVKDGRIEQTNFDSYNSMRIGEMPKVESIVMPSGESWGGVGEPTICVAAPAVLNAIFAPPASASDRSR